MGKEKRGYGPERTVTVERGRDGEVRQAVVKYHMTDPARISMADRRILVENVVGLATGS